MKQLARQTVYWNGIPKAIEKHVNSCDICNSMMVVPKSKCKSKWTPALRPFSRIHIDFFHFQNHSFLLIIDSFSKWLEIAWMKRGTDCAKVLIELVSFFSRFGLPDTLVSDGGPPFNSFSFTKFLKRQGIKVMKSPPYHPSSNGQAERLVRTSKDVLKKFLMEPTLKDLNLQDQISLFLFNYRNNNISEDGKCPTGRIFSYKPKTILDLINPKRKGTTLTNTRHPTPEHDENKTKLKNKKSLDPADMDQLIPGDVVWYKNHHKHIHAKWLKANFIARFSKHIFQVQVGSVVIHAHRDQLRIPKDNTNARPNVTTRVKGLSEEEQETEFRGFPTQDEEQDHRGYDDCLQDARQVENRMEGDERVYIDDDIVEEETSPRKVEKCKEDHKKLDERRKMLKRKAIIDNSEIRKSERIRKKKKIFDL